VIVVDGRQEDRSMGLNLDNFAALFEQEGCTEAYNLDGGVSAAMVFMGEQLNTHLNTEDKSKQRNLPDGLLWGYSEQVPSLSDPIYNDGIRRSGGKLNIR
ncbi:MAG: phosphodiester glycosidase family protein, partial [Clostridia bacterium]|nr:phosphodiester glycosidase family protein [Clostridia bacterium]